LASSSSSGASSATDSPKIYSISSSTKAIADSKSPASIETPIYSN